MAFSTEQRADQVAQANAEKNRNKEEAKEILATEAGVLQMASLAEEGGSMGRRIARELRQFEATGRVSNWLAGETIKAESKREVPSSVVDDFIRRGAVPATFQVQPALPFGGLPQYVPTIPSEGESGGGGGVTQRQPWDIYIKESSESGYTLRVQAGTLNGILPTNWDDEWVVSGSDLFFAKAIIATDGEFISSLEIQIDSSSPTNQQAQLFGLSSPIELLFGLFREGVSFRTVGPNFSASPVAWLIKEKDSIPSVGEIPWEIYYRLQC